MATDPQSQYMLDHLLHGLFERVLEHVVPTSDSRPYESISQMMHLPPQAVQDRHSPTVKAFTPAQQKKANEDLLASLDFDVFSFDMYSDDLLEFAEKIFASYGLLNTFKVSSQTFQSWIRSVRFHYHGENQFHNFRHAFNVLQTMHVFLITFNAKSFFNEVEVLALLFSCLCHDLQHPGFNNTFLSQTMHPLALRYNDQSVLENHHCSMAFHILNSSPKLNILASLIGDGSFAQGEQFRAFREMVVKMILSTDVSKHAQHVAALKENADAGFDKNKCEDKLRLMCALMEAADVSNEVRTFQFSRQWAPLVQEEFCSQGDKERSLGIPVKPMFDRAKASLPGDQQGFIKFLCLPLYTELARVLPQMQTCVDNLNSNASTWAAMES